MSERTEALMRIVVGIVSGIILCIWKALIQVIVVIHFIYVIFSGKKYKELAGFANYWNVQSYKYVRYMTFTTDHKPFPFSEIEKDLTPADLKK